MIAVSDKIAGFDEHLAAILRGKRPGWPFAPDAADAAMLWDRVQFHGIAGLLAECLPALDCWPEDLRQRVLEEARMQAFWEESHRALLVALLARLAHSGVRSLLMKGSALAYSLYADPATRRRGDTDLLVRESDLAQTRAALAEAGFVRRQDPHGLFFQEAWLADTGIGIVHALDLHWRPSDSPAVQRVLVTGEFFASATPLPQLSPHAAMPGAVLTFVQGAINQAWHASHGYFVDGQKMVGGNRLIWAWDNHVLALSFSEAQWQELADLAITRAVAPICLAALELARTALATPVPEAVLGKLGSGQNQTILAHHIEQKNRISAFLTDLAATPWREKVPFILGHALPDAAHLRGKYPGSESWPVPLLHLRRMAESAMRLARGR